MAGTHRPSIAPETLLQAQLQRVLCNTVGSEEVADGAARVQPLLLRWFVGLEMDDPV
jgi:hypothetical protein